MSSHTRLAVLTATSPANLTDKEGYFVEASSGEVNIVNATTDLPIGVIVSGTTIGGHNAVAMLGQVCRVKCDASAGAIVLGSKLALTATGTVTLAPTAASTSVHVAIALEAGANDALISALIIEPKSVVIAG